MKYLPFERITYRTDLSQQEIIKSLSDVVEPKKFSFGRNPIKDYEGSVDTDGFDISRVINYRNSFLPQIYGTIQNNNYGTEIQVTMSLNGFVFLFTIAWCLMATFSFVIVLMKGIRDKEITVEFFIPLIMLLFVYGLTMICFKIESKKSKEYLKKIFEAEITKE
ncbi:uncharacterized protein CHSO_1559 [Chryseobacterium sp. StRB126]|uniref:hypothetical protein n=1 Tax=Chryseobacterium sp. StRB126 TaxID=878220 RepID=UPI0004E98BAC|nr:hypothetical protein [Chryseobacterium sp. StRB126]BAP30596.1 uncharacterized protein CHSO_1559 [Chryseobacterium sp. StRB126]